MDPQHHRHQPANWGGRGPACRCHLRKLPSTPVCGRRVAEGLSPPCRGACRPLTMLPGVVRPPCPPPFYSTACGQRSTFLLHVPFILKRPLHGPTTEGRSKVPFSWPSFTVIIFLKIFHVDMLSSFCQNAMLVICLLQSCDVP